MRSSLEPVERAGRSTAARPRTHAAVALLCALLAAGCAPGGIDPATRAALIDAEVPAEHTDGRRLFDAHCAVCHGPAATGTPIGPPLVHAVYRARHHGDEAFQLAVAQGVRAHHWRFGHMPPIAGLDRDDVASITAYVRWLQRAAGVD